MTPATQLRAARRLRSEGTIFKQYRFCPTRPFGRHGVEIFVSFGLTAML